MSNLTTTHVVPWRLIARLSVVLAVGLIAGTALAQTGTLEGSVTDAGSGLPVEGAMLVAWGPGGMGDPGAGEGGGARYAFSDADGLYEFADMPAGDYLVFCGKVGYFLASAEATVVDGGVTVLDFSLQAKVFGSVAGVVTDASTGEPIAGARVGLRRIGDAERGPGGPGGGGFWLHAITGSDGTYLIERIPAGEYQVGAVSHGYYPSELQTVTVVDGVTAEANFALDALAFGRLEGRVTDAVSGEPIAGAHVTLWRATADGGDGIGGGPGGGFWLHAVTGDDGFYAIENVPADDYEARIFAYGYFPSEPVPVTVLADETAVVDFELYALVFGSIEGTVTDAVTGDPIANAVVIAVPPWPHGLDEGTGDASEGRWNFTLTDENGFYRLEEVPAGSWVVRAYAWGYRAGSVEVEVLDGQTTVANLALEPYTSKTASSW
jgi:protocatechuate 3,4-dioxygenase beta subunit